MCVSLLGCAFIFNLFMLVVFGFLFCWCHDFFTHDEDIVTFRCEGGEPCSCTLFHVFRVVLYYFGLFHVFRVVLYYFG